MSMLATPLRSASSWQKLHCTTCREETTHHRNVCIHCKQPSSGRAVAVAVQYNGRPMTPRLSTEQHAQAKQMLGEGISYRIVAKVLRISQAQLYKLHPVPR